MSAYAPSGGLKVQPPFKHDTVADGWIAKCFYCNEDVYGYDDDDSDGFKRFIGWFHESTVNPTAYCPRKPKVVPSPADLGSSING